MYNYGRIYWPFCQGGVKNACSFKTWSGAMTRLGASGSAGNNNARRDETQALRATPVRSHKRAADACSANPTRSRIGAHELERSRTGRLVVSVGNEQKGNLTRARGCTGPTPTDESPKTRLPANTSREPRAFALSGRPSRLPSRRRAQIPDLVREKIRLDVGPLSPKTQI